MTITKVKNKATAIAVRTFFSDAIGYEFEIWEWLCATEDADADCPYPIWDCASKLNILELYEVVNGLREDIIYSFRASNNVE